MLLTVVAGLSGPPRNIARLKTLHRIVVSNARDAARSGAIALAFAAPSFQALSVARAHERFTRREPDRPASCLWSFASPQPFRAGLPLPTVGLGVTRGS